MNLLAHQLLSFNDPEISVGNFIADAVKGKKYEQYNLNIQKGILLHRRIDDFMDHHPISIEGIKRLRPDFHKYSTVIIDILYDHFLARNWNKFHQLPLHEFVQRQYKFLHEYQSIMPEMPKRMLAYMSKQNWLESYIEIKGIIQALEGMSRRIKHDYQLDNAVEIMLRHYDDYENEVLEFIPQILLKSEEWLKEINALKS